MKLTELSLTGTIVRILGFALLVSCSSPGIADELPAEKEWQHSVDIYVWGAAVGGETNSGTGVDVSFDDLLDNLEFSAMGAYQARKGKWSVMADLIYLDVSNRAKFELGGDSIRVPVEVDTDLTSWVVHAGGAYNFYEGDGGTMAGLTFGARYLDMSTDIVVGLESRVPELDPEIPISASEDVLDFFAGLHGVITLGERWFLPWAANVGTGDSDISWAALAGVGYRVSDRWNAILTYRHQAWDFEDTVIIDSLEFSGPMLGAVVRF
jgi:opacity protein-like surface antigen